MTVFQDGGFDGEQTTVPNLDNVNMVIVAEQEVTLANKLSSDDFSVVEDRAGDCVVEIGKEQEDMNTILDINVDDFGPLEHLEMDTEFSLREFSEAFDSCFDVDMVEPSKAGDDSQENGTSLEESMPKEAEHELQLKEMELQKLIHNSGVDEEVEEGEISGDFWVGDESIDILSEDVVSLGGRNAEMVQDMSEPSMVNIENNDNNSMQVELRITAGQRQDYHSQNLCRDSYMGTPTIGPIAPHLKNLTPSSRNLLENDAENQTSGATEKEGDVSKKKRRQGPCTQEGKAKKKDRIRRARKDRELGVKRLKLQPVLKPKTIQYCRHYLQGRCDKPCVHFARHACMKGDDCTFDHQLAKYPCLNYTSNGFCIRGSDFLLSHESSLLTPSVSQPKLKSGQPTLLEKEGPIMLPKAASPKTTFQSPPSNSSFSKQTDNCGSSSRKCTNLLAAKAVPRTPGQAPKGLSFLLNGGMSLGETSKLNHDGPSVNTNNVIDVNRETILKVPGGINNSNNTSDGIPPRKPLNFLSVAQPSLDDFSSKMFSNLLSNCNYDKGKSVIGDSGEGKGKGKGKQTCSLPESVEVLKVNRQMSQSTCLQPGPLKEVNGTPLTTGQRLSLLSTDKTQFDNPIFMERANDHFSKTYASSLVQKAVQTTLAFAAKFDLDIKAGSYLHQQGR